MKTIYKGKSKESGIYKIINVKSGKIYIGSCKRFKRRLSGHLSSLKRGTHHNKHLQAAFNKCGEDAFVFEVIEVVEGAREVRTLVEQRYIREEIDRGNWSNCYNSDKKTANKEGPWSHTPEETRRKISESVQAVWDDPEYKFNNSGKNHKRHGCKLSEEHKKSLAAAHVGMTGKKHSEETRHKMSLSAQKKDMAGNSIRQKTYDVVLVSPNKKEHGPITNLKKFCRTHALVYSCMRGVINKKRNYHKGWVLKVE